MEALLALLGKADNIAVLVLLAVCTGLGWAHIVWRRFFLGTKPTCVSM